MQALMLAAGLGKRLAKYTKNNTKCMVEVAGERLIDRAIRAVEKAGIKKFIIVTGYKGNELKKYILDNHAGELEFVFINNSDYSTTNNIYSFFLAKEELIKDDTILMESDIIFEDSLIKNVVDYEQDNVVVIAKYESWMDGTCVTLNEDGTIRKFVEKRFFDIHKSDLYFKTVNIYKFTKEFLKNVYLPFLETYMSIQGVNSYYETSLKYICLLPDIKFHAFKMLDRPWYEIDDSQDLDIANVLFSNGEKRYKLIESKFGGYWRYPNYLDFCYLVNPYFPTKQMVEKMQNEFPVLLTQYPSGLNVQNMNASRLYGIDEDKILVGNGAAELINALGHVVGNSKVAVNLPAFNEYIRCFNKADIIEIDNSVRDYSLNVDAIKSAIDKSDYIAIINPDNPSGFMLSKNELVDIIKYAKKHNTNVIVDESFVDFAVQDKRYTLLDNDFINEYNNLIVIKSISKSYGVPGLRLGLLATSNTDLISQLRKEMQIWNINSFAEYYFQVYQLFAGDYKSACDKIAEERTRLASELKKIKWIQKVYDSEANYLMVDLGEINSRELAIKLLDEEKIIIKDLSTKNKFFGKNFVRIAVRDFDDNNTLINCLNRIE